MVIIEGGRNIVARFTPEARKANLALVGCRTEEGNACSDSACMAAAKKLWIVPIPGTPKLQRLEENIGGAAVELTSEDLHEIDSAASKITIQ